MTLGELVLLVVGLALLVPAAVLWGECVAALLPVRGTSLPSIARPRIAVVVPARNEAAAIRSCLASVAGQLNAADRLLVVADNCTDDTGAIARACGALVIERTEPGRYGKGYAIDCALRHLDADSPEVLVVVDADCIAAPGAIEILACQAAATGRPVQATYVLTGPPDSTASAALSALAFTIKNLVRPRGLHRLGLPCLLTGSGMAFPWAIMRAVSLASSHGVEDMQLSVDLALAGHPPQHSATARVTGQLVTAGRAAGYQRRRWEHGHIAMLFSGTPRLLRAALRRHSLELLALALDLSVPPLSLFVLAWTVTAVAATGFAAVGGSTRPVALVALSGGLVVTALMSAWLKFGRAIVAPSALRGLPLYIVRKIPLYAAFATRSQRTWEPAQPFDNLINTAEPTSIELGGISLHTITEAGCVDFVLHELAAGRGGWIATLNLDHLRLVARSARYAQVCAHATLRVADGMPLVWASRLQRTPLPERVAGSNLISSLTAAAAEYGYSIFLLGGAPETAERTAAVFRERHPTLRIAGTLSPDLDLDRHPQDLEAVAASVCAAQPDIVYVALGKPKQELVIENLRARLPRAWFVPVGISFSFVSGAVRRAPHWMQRMGLEWLHRLVRDPERLARRYLLEGVPFALALLTGAALKRLRGRRASAPPG